MYIDCDNPEVIEHMRSGALPSALCNYPPEVQAAICARQPSLCTPYGQAVQPSIWEPIIGTAQGVGDRILTTSQNVGTGVLGTLNSASYLMQFLPLILLGVGVYYVTRK